VRRAAHGYVYKSTVMETGNFVRFERVTSVDQTELGVVATLIFADCSSRRHRRMTKAPCIGVFVLPDPA
jgi:hypothetical protein